MACLPCGASTGDGQMLCYACTTGLEANLVRVDEVVQELRVTIERGDVGAEQCGNSGTRMHAPAPINLSAMELEAKLHNDLMSWSLRIIKEHLDEWHRLSGHGPRPVLPGRSAHQLSNYLMTQIPYLRKQVWAVDLMRRLAKHLDDCATACEREQPRIFAGVCPDDIGGIECGTYVYEPQGAVTARCKTCGYSWDIVEWTGRALVSKEYVIGYPPALSRMLSTGGVPVTEQDIRNWAARGVLDRANPAEDDRGRELRAMYRLGDVLDAWEATTRKQAA